MFPTAHKPCVIRMVDIALTNTFNFITSINFKWHNPSSRQAFWFCFTVDQACCLLPAEGAHNVPLSTWSFFRAIVIASHSALLTLSHIHPSSLMPSLFCSYSVQSHTHSRTCSSTLCYEPFLRAHNCPLQLEHILCSTTSFIQLFTLEIHSLLYRYTAGIQLLAVAHLFSAPSTTFIKRVTD